jgi:hypothetical protein
MYSNTGGGAIYTTTNGGTSWTKTSGTAFTGGWLNFVHLFDANNGVCMGDPNGGGTPAEWEIMTTSNGGSTWTRVAGANIPNPQSGEYGGIGTYSANGNRIWFGTNKTRIYYSFDKGATWSVKQVKASMGSIYRMDFQDDTHGFAIYLNAAGNALGGIAKTTDGGANWSDLAVTGGENFYLSAITSPQSNFIISAGGNNTGISTNYGATWTPGDTLLPLTEIINSIEFYNNALGWAGTISSGTSNGGIYKFTDPSSGIVKHNNNDISMNIFPNPTNGLLNIEIQAKDKVTELAIYDMIGQLVYLDKNIPAGNKFQKTIDLSNETKGVFLLTIKNGEQIYTQRVILN